MQKSLWTIDGFAKKINYQLVLQAFKRACIVLNPKLLCGKLFEFNNIPLRVEDEEPKLIS